MPATEVFGALAHPARRRILELLSERPLPAGEIASVFEMGRPAVSEHLQVLRLAGLVSEEPRGRQRIYRLEPEPLGEVAEWLAPFERYWKRRFELLRETLDEEANNG